MTLSKVAILAVRGMDRATRKELAQKMGITEDTMYRWIRNNSDNLTKAAYLSVLSEELGLPESELLEKQAA